MPSSACYRVHRSLHSFPTRRSSDLEEPPFHVVGRRLSGITGVVRVGARIHLVGVRDAVPVGVTRGRVGVVGVLVEVPQAVAVGIPLDRKSTRLNSSHLGISYAVFCLLPRPPFSPLFPYTTLFRSGGTSLSCRRPAPFRHHWGRSGRRPNSPRRRPRRRPRRCHPWSGRCCGCTRRGSSSRRRRHPPRSEEHTSELQSLRHLVCRLLLATASTVLSTLSLHDALPIWRNLPFMSSAGAFPASLGSFGSAPEFTSSASETPSPSVSPVVGSVLWVYSSRFLKPSPSASP